MSAMSEAVDAAMFLCPMEGDPRHPVLSAEECRTMVSAAVATFLHEMGRAVGEHAGLNFGCADEE